MTVTASDPGAGAMKNSIGVLLKKHTLLAQLVGITAIGMIISMVWEGAIRWPAELVLPLKFWLTDFFKWLGKEAAIGDYKFKEFTRSISWVLAQPLKWTEYALFRGIKMLGLPPIPWVAFVIGVGILGHWIGGVRLAIFCIVSFAYLAVFGLWKDSMKTLSVVLVSVPFAAIIGLWLGIWVTRSRKAAAIITPMFDLMQATPHMAYLVPIVILFGFGQVPAMMATVIFAMPPMARCVILGIQTVPSDVIESGRMSGCTQRQLLWKVQLPTAKRTLMLGLDQVVMQTLAMAVIASLVGAAGLGQKLLFSLQQLRLGAAVEQGLAIVLIAVVLDRLTQAYAYRQPQHLLIHKTWFHKHAHLLTFLVVLIVTFFLASFWKELAILPKKLTFTLGRDLDHVVRWISKESYDYIQPVRDFITVSMLIPLRDFYLWIPWLVVMGIVGVAGFYLGGLAVAGLTCFLIGMIVITGFWVPAVLTVYLVSASVVICILIGLPIGIWASRSERVARVSMSICDTLQTFPSFIYLIPVIMLFKVGDLSNIIAILAYASVPAVRYTYLGLKRVPEVLKEAALANGCTPSQKFWKVELPFALPEIMLGINQTIMMALAMTAITALIGSQDLGQEIYRALPTADTGRGILAGLGIASIGIIADRLIGAWAKERKAILGIS
ncbi:MAG: ABC transporter permease subunit [Gammaproteobacteria bacterium]|nr:ABC transporter permease subunit [Gammaproteobacteria bacterium]